MMADLSAATQRRITFLSLFDTLQGDFDTTISTFEALVEDGRFFDQNQAARPTSPSSSGPRPASPRPASPSRPPTRGRDNQPFTGQLRDPDCPPTDKQVAAALKLTDEYSEDDLYSFTKQQVSDLISDLKG